MSRIASLAGLSGLAALLLLGAPSGAEPTQADLEAARSVVVGLYEQLLGAMKGADQLGLEGRREKLGPAVRAAYDLPLMGAKVLGRHWRGLSDEEKERWVATFERLTIATYAERFDGWQGEELVIDGAEAGARDTIVVHTRIVRPKKDPVPIHYRLRQREGQWRVIDVFLNGTVSELALRRSEYGSVVEKDGLSKLIAQLDGKIAAGQASADVASELD